MKKRWCAFLICVVLLFTGCGRGAFSESGMESGSSSESESAAENGSNSENETSGSETAGESPELGDDSKSFGEDLESEGAYDGYFEEESGISIHCVSGTENAYKLEDGLLTFTAVDADIVYSVSGAFKGRILIDVGDGARFDLELCGFSLVSEEHPPITILSGDEVGIKAKKDTENYIYDMRGAIDPSDGSQIRSAVYSEVDLEIGGKGKLTLVSENNNGIHTKGDLQVQNLTLFVACIDNALKGNDSVELLSGETTLIASGGDCIKTTNSNISEKGNQRGSITVTGGVHTLYAACDGMDAAFNVCIDGEGTEVSIYTDKYSNYSKEVTENSEETNYIRFTSDAYSYSVKYYNSEEDFVWVNAEYHSKVSGGRTTYYYYSYPKMPEYEKQQFFIYESEEHRGQEEEFLAKSDYLTPNSGCDTFALTSSYQGLRYQWTNYTTKVQTGGFGGGFGGMGEGNTDKSDRSTKGIKAENEILILGGRIQIKSYDDAIHANGDGSLENGAVPLGNVTVSGGIITLYSNDDGIHADGALTISGGTVRVTNAYEGLEGTTVQIEGGCVSVYSKDDGVNATATTGTAITIGGGEVYIYCTGDGIDSNSRTSDVGIVFSGGRVVVISNSGMNSAIDSENGYTYTRGSVVAIMPRGGMSNEATHCDNFSSIGKSLQCTLQEGAYFRAKIGAETVTVTIPVSLSAMVILLGDRDATFETGASAPTEADENGVAWQYALWKNIADQTKGGAFYANSDR